MGAYVSIAHSLFLLFLKHFVHTLYYACISYLSQVLVPGEGGGREEEGGEREEREVNRGRRGKH